MDMKLLLTSEKPPMFEGQGGSYRSWTSKDYPVLAQTNVGAGLLILKPRGFALPHCSDSSKLGYVVQGENGVAGLLATDKGETEETVVNLKTGVIIPVASGSTSWWYNHGESDLIVAFLGEINNSYVPGEFTYFLFSGVASTLGGFSTEFITKAYNITQTQAKSLTKSQTGVLLIQLTEQQGNTIPQPKQNDVVKEIEESEDVVEVERGGKISRFEFGVGLRCGFVELESDAMLSPGFNGDGSVEIVYVGRGSGRVEIVGVEGKCVLDCGVVAGQVFVVPRFFGFAVVADVGSGMEFFYVKTNSRSADVTDYASLLNGFSTSIFQHAFNLPLELVDLFKKKTAENDLLIPSRK